MQKNVWFLADNRMGNVNQLLGISEELQMPYERKDISYNAWVRLPNLLRGATLVGLDKESQSRLQAPWPAVVLSAGRRSFPVARWIKKMSGGKTKIVHMMNPGCAGFSEADLIILPTHDQYKGHNTNVMQVSGAPHCITSARLASEHAYWAKKFDAYPQPRLSLIVGGATKNKPFTVEMADELVQGVLDLKPASVLLTTSRRTPAAVIDVLKERLPKNTFFYQFGDKAENPYFGLLAWADMLVVTGDSISMCSECCATTAPVYIFAPAEMMSEKHKRFHADLYKNGYASKLGGKMTQKLKGGGYNPDKKIAHRIKTELEGI